MSLELEGLSFSWPGGAPLLSGVGLRLGPGSILALLGPNGAGKSTLLSLAAGRREPSSGSASLEGRELRAWDRRSLARHLAFLPQTERLPFNYTVRDFVLLGRAPHVPTLSLPGEEDELCCDRAIVELGLESLAGRAITELSGGELQLVRLARCLVQEAEYLLLDEPSTALDPANARRLADELRRLAAGGRAILLTTHDAAFASYVAAEALLLRRGEVVASGPSSAVLVREFLEAAFGLPFGRSPVPSAFGVIP